MTQSVRLSGRATFVDIAIPRPGAESSVTNQRRTRGETRRGAVSIQNVKYLSQTGFHAFGDLKSRRFKRKTRPKFRKRGFKIKITTGICVQSFGIHQPYPRHGFATSEIGDRNQTDRALTTRRDARPLIPRHGWGGGNYVSFGTRLVGIV